MSGRIWIIAAAVLWSFGGVLTKILTGDPHQVDPNALACLRSAFAAGVLIWALPGIRGVPAIRAGGAGIAYTFIVWCFVLATSQTTAANAIFLQYFYPLLTAIGAALFFNEKAGPRTFGALLIGTAGVVTILVGSWTPEAAAGLGTGIGAAFAFAAFTLIQRGIREGSPIGLACLYNLIAAVALLPVAWGTFDLPVTVWVLIAVMGIVQLGLPYIFFIKGLKTVPAAEAALITLVEPVLNPLWVWLVVGENPGLWTVIGGATILFGLVVRFAGKRRE